MITEFIVSQWIIRIWYPICSVFIALLIRNDLSKRKNDIRIDNDPYPKWLNLWSFLALLSYFISTITWFLTTFQFTCYYAVVAIFALYSMGPIFLTMFQITRLQYCFYSGQVHSVKYGYPKCLFIILYCIGSILLIVSSMPIFMFYSKTSNDMMTKYESCNALNMKDYMTGFAEYVSISSLSITIYFGWDIVVLCLFIFKVCQIKSKFKEQEDRNNIYRRIRFILQKITILTVLFEIKHFMKGGLDLMTHFDVKYALIVDSVYYGADHAISTILIYLMIERNNDQYIEFMKIFCCGKCVDYPNEDNAQPRTPHVRNREITDLKTSEETVNIEARQYEHESEITTTIIV